MIDINPEVDPSILKKTGDAKDVDITNPSAETADVYIQALQKKIDSDGFSVDAGRD